MKATVKQPNDSVGNKNGNPRICFTDNSNNHLYFIGEPSNEGENILWIGVNPKTSGLEDSDYTITKIKGFTRRLVGAEGWILINLYPMRAMVPEELPAKPDQEIQIANLTAMIGLFTLYNISKVVCCWGNLVQEYPMLLECKAQMLEKIPTTNLFQLGTQTQKNEPRHPSRLGYSVPITRYEV